MCLRGEGRKMNKPIVLFLCTGNSARSQMAEALLRHAAGDRLEVRSAGLEAHGIHPLTVQVMQEMGIDISQQQSKPLRDYLGRLAVRVAITVCMPAEANCPIIWPNALAHLSWPFENPAVPDDGAAQMLERFRRVRDQIHAKITAWLNEPLDG